MKSVARSGKSADARAIRQLLRACETRFTDWEVPTPFTITRLVEHLSDRRNRLIHLIPTELGADRPSGIWLALPALDVVIYESRTSRTHQEHIIAHELAHMLCEHTQEAPLDRDTAGRLFPGLDPRLVQQMMGRTKYPDGDELEAEVMASVILCRMNSRPPSGTSVPDSDSRGILHRLERSFSIGGGSAV
ncbi:hypothetical protein [Streptomyces alanosinicus]|uniref:hypothetical protein n=1 Tax=Streptomyces alanosinicus TaxID=68171 RepID=UPI00167BA4B9|nr:hypothetical protein [Streptomyces alanosinicus]